MQAHQLPDISLEFREGSSDKVYRACIEASGDGYVVNFAYGRRGATLNTGTKTQQPMAFAAALSLYEKLVQSKTAKGYKPAGGVQPTAGLGTPLTARERSDTGLRPQLLNPITDGEVTAYLDDDVLKDLSAPWSLGRPANGGTALKCKFWASCSCVVLKINARRSVELELGGRSVGNVTIPPNHEVPGAGQVVEIRYLYVTGPGGSLYQPIYLGVRDDVRIEDCTFERQRIKFKTAA